MLRGVDLPVELHKDLPSRLTFAGKYGTCKKGVTFPVESLIDLASIRSSQSRRICRG